MSAAAKHSGAIRPWRKSTAPFKLPRPEEPVSMPITLYGIKACDTMKKARTWLDDNKVAYTFHDYKIAGIDAKRVAAWCDVLGWEKVLNRAGTTFRKLSDADKAGIDQKKAVALMVA